MDFDTVCPKCHVNLPPASYFCFNCGKKLIQRPLSISIPRQFFVYFVSFFLAPFGLVWGIKYLKQAGYGSKIIGSISILLTVLAIVIAVWLTNYATKSINNIVNQQLNAGVNSQADPKLYEDLNKQLQMYQNLNNY